jgi:hypothetical protein
MFYIQMLLAFPALTLVLPSATTRTGILIHVYAQALELSGVRPDSPLSRAIMMALNSINRLACPSRKPKAAEILDNLDSYDHL